MKPRLLDLFCGAGGASMGYHRAGFEVIGVDINPQPHYPFEFHQVDALSLDPWEDLGDYSAVHASPPCQLYSTQRTGVTGEFQKLIPQVRALLEASGLPYVIENVVGARSELINPIMLCGTTLGCVDDTGELHRHRLFESNLSLAPLGCDHQRDRRALGVYGHLAVADRPNRPSPPAASHRGWKAGKARARTLMGIDWEVTDHELAEAIPPAYTQHVGRQIAAWL